ncbi:hypothetical protein LU631_02815 [Erwinia tracheiphila]|uniref:glycine-rich domain-containing protein n=1 Tax=Erwinia tracheiphila TaxID=65700 RepID=UPI00033BB8EF|nr:hypothetical protein [Erwinia tracheiphila]EOS94766.1 hypothetical protein ETR_11968 [Erwinia tracheiphila PSU-1]UIA88380.1 hypothetical protein LU631_02815 [Erwinia tracheiphila]UIA96199.1 hypothetical protein LU633_23345 [Erwinia tracheiphila]
MKQSDSPKKQTVPFGVNGQREDLLGTTPAGDNTASYDSGFPPVTMILKAAGGLPPKGQNMNQILYELSCAAQWANAGGGYNYDSDFASSISGYPKGALLPNSTNDGYWLNTSDNNNTNPENSTAALTGWVPVDSYGATSISGLSASSVTLSTLQASKDIIYLSGALTSNINVIVPAWIKGWSVVNNCTGAYTVTIKTPSGTGIATSPYSNNQLQGDGTNIIQGMSAGRRLGAPRVFTASGTYTPTAGTNWIEVLVVGAGGGGAGAAATAVGQMAGGSGGGGGGYAMSRLTSGFSGVYVTVGIAGIAGDGSPSNGGKGGDSSFGSILSATGGIGGAKQPGVNNTVLTLQLGAPGGSGSSGNILNGSGGSGGQLILNTDSNSTGGTGGSSYLSGTAKGVGANSSGNSGTLGSGGSGAVSGSSPDTGYSGGAGGGGCVIIWEYA